MRRRKRQASINALKARNVPAACNAMSPDDNKLRETRESQAPSGSGGT